MGRLNLHKAPGRSQLSKTDMGTLERNGPTRTRPVGQPHTTRHDALDRTNMPQGRKKKMRRPKVHKAPRWSQLSKIDIGALEQNGPTQTRLVGQPHMA